MAWEENSRICLHMQLIAILSRTGVVIYELFTSTDTVNFLPQFGIRIVHKKVGSLTNILYLYR